MGSLRNFKILPQQKKYKFLRFNWSIKLSVIGVWLLGLLLTFLLAWLVQEQNKESLQARIDGLTQPVEQLVKKRFEQYEYGFLGLRRALLAVDSKRLNFERYIESRDLPDNLILFLCGFKHSLVSKKTIYTYILF